MKKLNKTLALAAGTSLITGLVSVSAQANPFSINELSSGYMQLAEAGQTTSTPPAKTKAPEGKCAGDKPITAPKVKEGKCGEGKCGDMKNEKTAAGKTGEGKCGEGKCGDAMKAKAEKPAQDTKVAPK